MLYSQLVKTTRPGLALAPPPDLSPKLRPAHLEVLALGIRGMQPFEMFPMQMPYMELEVRESQRSPCRLLSFCLVPSVSRCFFLLFESYEFNTVHRCLKFFHVPVVRPGCTYI